MTTLEEGIKMLFNEIDENCEIVKFESVNAEDNFSVLLRTKLTNEEKNWGSSCNKWMEKFTIQTNSKWIVRATFPAAQRMDYRKVFTCKENRSNKYKSQNLKCDAKVDMKVKKVTESTLKKDKLLKKGYNVEIKVHIV